MLCKKIKRKIETDTVEPATKLIKLELQDLKPVIKTEPIKDYPDDKIQIEFHSRLDIKNSKNSNCRRKVLCGSKNGIKKEVLSNSINICDTSGEESTTTEVIQAVSSQLFNTDIKKENITGCEDQKWLQMEAMYENLLKFLETHEFKTGESKEGIGKNFVCKVTELIPKAISIEMPLVMKVLRQLYTKFIHLRKNIRKEYTILLRGILKVGEAPGWVPNLLGFVACIIKGLEVPLKNEHATFFKETLLPLHKIRNVATFHAQLASCTMFFIRKEPELCGSAVDFLRGMWMDTEPDTQMVLLDEIRDVACFLKDDVPNCDSIVENIFMLIADCFNSCKSQKVLEKTLYFWSESGPKQLLRKKVHLVMPIVFQSVRHLTKVSDPLIVGLAYNVLKIFMDTDVKLFKQLRKRK